MLRALRNQTNSIFFKCFLVLLICGFALWGVGDLTGGAGEKKVLTVNNENVTVEEVINEINRLRYSLPERPSLQEALKKGMHRGVIQRFEKELLLNSEANILDLSVPLTVKTKAIRQENAFMDPLGKFSQNKFLQSLQNAGLSEAKYLEMIKSEANLQQLSMPYSFNNNYDDIIIKKIMDWQNETRNINYEIFDMVNKNDISKPSENVLKAFYNKHKDNYKIPATRNIKFLEINPSTFQDQVVINEKQINEKYEIEKSNYFTEEKREILQITTQDEIKAKEFVNLIKNGADFKKLAKKIFDLSESDTNIGVLKKADLPLKSAGPVFKAKLNKILGPIKTKFGFSIYKVIKIDEKKEINYENAIKDIKEKLLKELSVEILFEKLEEIEDLIAEGNNLNEISKSELFNKKIPVKFIKMVSRNGLIYAYDKEKIFINKDKIFLKNIWNTDINELSELFNSNEDNYNLIQVLKENPEEIPSFEKVKKNIYGHWLNKEIIFKSKEKVRKLIINKNNNLLSNIIIERTTQSIGKVDDALLIQKIFEIKDKEINLFNTNNYVFAVKLSDVKTKSYDINKDAFTNLNSTLSQSFYKDFLNFYLGNLAVKHSLKRNLAVINNILNNEDIAN